MLWLPVSGLALGYLLLLLLYGWGWARLPRFRRGAAGQPALLHFTVLVPMHNESARIAGCLDALNRVDYPRAHMEVLVLDDGSTDQSVAIVREWAEKHPDLPLRLLQLSKIGKKSAIAAGVQVANGTHIVCTDADCTPPPKWLLCFADAFERQNCQLAAGPVAFDQYPQLLTAFQALDMIGMMAITGSGIHLGWQRMANGANMAYVKAVFEAVGGYTGNAHIASGDDLFLVQKIARHYGSNAIFFLKSTEAIVLTPPMTTWKGFVRQRIRWGSKNAALPEWPVRLSLLLVFVVCWAIIGLGIAACFCPAGYAGPFALLLLTKLTADYLFLSAANRFFGQKGLFKWFLPAQLTHTAYVALIGLAGIFAPKGNGTW